MSISQLQKLWLTTQGDRTVFDTFCEDGRYYVQMNGTYGQVKMIELPSDNLIQEDFYVANNGREKVLRHKR